MDKKGHTIDQKGLKMYEKRQKKVLGPKYLVFSGIFLSGIGGYPPLTENHSAQKPLAEMGGIPPPLAASLIQNSKLRPNYGCRALLTPLNVRMTL